MDLNKFLQWIYYNIFQNFFSGFHKFNVDIHTCPKTSPSGDVGTLRFILAWYICIKKHTSGSFSG